MELDDTELVVPKAPKKKMFENYSSVTSQLLRINTDLVQQRHVGSRKYLFSTEVHLSALSLCQKKPAFIPRWSLLKSLEYLFIQWSKIDSNC